MAFLVMRGGIGLTRRLGAAWQHMAPNECMDTLPRTERRRTDGPLPGTKTWDPLSSG